MVTLYLPYEGTEKKREIITDLHCGVSTCTNRQPVHAGFNNTFNSLKQQLELAKIFCIDVFAYAVMSNQQNVGTFYNSAAGPQGGRHDA